MTEPKKPAQKLDPYVELDVARDADAETIKRAARKRHRQTHPDAGGDVDAFERSRRAELVLLDPLARKKFDETGDIDDDGPNNDRAAALQIIEAFVANMLQEFITSGFDRRKDLRNDDFLERFVDKIEEELYGLDQQPALIDQGIALLEDMKARLTTTDLQRPMHRSLDKRIEEFKGQRAQAIKAAEVRRMAISIAEAHDFRFDQPKPEGDAEDTFAMMARHIGMHPGTRWR